MDNDTTPRAANTNWWLIGIAVGVLIGGALAFLLSPYSGKALRAKLLGGVDRARREVRGLERFGGGAQADPLLLAQSRLNQALDAAKSAYTARQEELTRDLTRRQTRLLE